MGYAIHARDGQWPPNPPVDGEPVAWHYRASKDECEGGEVYLEELPDGLSEPRWDTASGTPRARTDEELAEQARAEANHRIANEAVASLGIPGGPFIDNNEVIGIVTSVVHKILNDETPTDREQQAIALIASLTPRVEEKKQEIKDADPKDLGSISWEDE